MEAPPRPPPVLPDDIVEEILLRFPPDDPASLVRAAALVCKPWCRVVAGGGFRRRFRQFHLTPPMLGLLCDTNQMTRFVPTSSFRPPHGGDQLFWFWHAMDARHGRVLLHSIRTKSGEPWDVLVVWNPITGNWRELPTPREYLDDRTWSGAVLCAANGDDACDHLDCDGGPFQVVMVGCDDEQIDACVYSSEAGSWSQPASSQLQHRGGHFDFGNPSALVEDSLYFAVGIGTILKYNLASQESSAIDLPPVISWIILHEYNLASQEIDSWQHVVHVTAFNGRLGFAIIGGFKLHLWSREAGHDKHAGWTRSRVIDLRTLLPVGSLLSSLVRVHGLAGGIGFCFVCMGDAVFSIDLKSNEAKKVCNVSAGDSSSILPYMNFCTPSIGSVLYK